MRQGAELTFERIGSKNFGGNNKHRVRTRQRIPDRGGFYLRELVVFFIVPMALLSLLFPAVHRVREAARRMQCANQLKALGIAAANHDSVFRSLPSGVYARNLLTISDADPLQGEAYFGWCVPLLPYLDYPAHFASIEEEFQSSSLKGCLKRPEALATLQATIPTLRCPSDTGAPLVNFGRAFFDDQNEVPLSYSSYVGVNGSGDLWRKDAMRGAGGSNGLFYLNSRIPLSGIEDGTSNTFLFGERAWSRSNGSFRKPIDSRGSVVFGTRSVREKSWVGLADVLASGKFRVNFNAVEANGELGTSYARRAFSSKHPGGANFLRADNSIMFVNERINSDQDERTQVSKTENEVDSVWEQLLSRNDGAIPKVDD